MRNKNGLNLLFENDNLVLSNSDQYVTKSFVTDGMY